MLTSQQEVIDWISSHLKFGIRPGLERMELALKKLGNPHLAIPTIHIAGTNGKGSTVTYLRCVLEEAGYQVGTFTSPYIELFNERISKNGIPIHEDDLVWCANQIKPTVEAINETEIGPFTEFELITLLSFVYFNKVAVDVVIYEVGLGGRLDATNVISPMVCGITNIGHDHEAILGDTLVKIAYEKLGIVKEGIPLITTEENEEILGAFKKVTQEKHSELIQALAVYPPTQIQLTEDGTSFNWPDLQRIELRMKGIHQVKNATLAYGIIKFLKEKRKFQISSVHLYRGMKKAFWAGRFEVISKSPTMVLDGAHNLEGMTQLSKTVKKLYQDKRPIFLVSILKDKDYEKMFRLLEEVAGFVYFTTFTDARSQSAKHQYEVFNRENSAYDEDLYHLLENLLPTLKEDDCLIITGSLYFISEVRKFLMQ